jgi:hypothetical protein
MTASLGYRLGIELGVVSISHIISGEPGNGGTMNKRTVFTVFGLLTFIVLAGMAAVNAAAAEVDVPMKGSIEVQAIYTPDLETNTIRIEGNGSGNATHLGRFVAHYDVVLNLLTGVGAGEATFVAANGDRLFTYNVGQTSPTGNPGELRIVETYTITGGTGRFAGASGSFGGERLVNQATGYTSGSFDGNIVLP